MLGSSSLWVRKARAGHDLPCSAGARTTLRIAGRPGAKGFRSFGGSEVRALSPMQIVGAHGRSVTPREGHY